MNSEQRKQRPVTTGVLDYFPDAIKEVAHVSYVGNEQHNPGQPMHWNRSKSKDHADCIARHLIERGTIDTDNLRHSAKVAWRALALLQIEIEDTHTQAHERIVADKLTQVFGEAPTGRIGKFTPLQYAANPASPIEPKTVFNTPISETMKAAEDAACRACPASIGLEGCCKDPVAEQGYVAIQDFDEAMKEAGYPNDDAERQAAIDRMLADQYNGAVRSQQELQELLEKAMHGETVTQDTFEDTDPDADEEELQRDEERFLADLEDEFMPGEREERNARDEADCHEAFLKIEQMVMDLGLEDFDVSLLEVILRSNGCPKEVAEIINRSMSIYQDTNRSTPYAATYYIAGPMRGYPGYNFASFDQARNGLVKEEIIVISPADIDRAAGGSETSELRPQHEYVLRDFHCLMYLAQWNKYSQNAIYALRGWENSKGACAEVALAKWLGIQVIQEGSAQDPLA
jgi:hypothetical protein